MVNEKYRHYYRTEGSVVAAFIGSTDVDTSVYPWVNALIHVGILAQKYGEITHPDGDFDLGVFIHEGEADEYFVVTDDEETLLSVVFYHDTDEYELIEYVPGDWERKVRNWAKRTRNLKRKEAA